MRTKAMELNDVIEELRTCTENTIIFRKLINFASSREESWDDEYLKRWQPVLIHVVESFIPSTEIGREKALLASHTFFALLSMQPSLILLRETFSNLVNSERNEVFVLGRKYRTAEHESLKLICAHGFLQVNRREIYSNDVCLVIFDVIFEHCIRYTKYSYFAYKILYTWLRRTANTNFWSTSSELEEKLEAIIFSNWCNAINEISKQNSALVFNMYLRIMENKYSGYSEYLFRHCVSTISWQNELKYDILAEICEVSGKTDAITSYEFLLSLSTSLTKYHLRSAGTKVYLAIAKKLSENEWKEAFGRVTNYLFHRWQTPENENYTALQLLCKHWLEPIVKKYRNILPYLWDLIADIKGHFLRSYLERMACEVRVDLVPQATIECYVNHSKEVVRLNGFAINCYRVLSLYKENRDRFFTIRSFLWHNANSTSVYVRDGIVKYLRVFLANVLKMCENTPDCISDVYYIAHWLHEFLLDCFEIGSCYQRKILGLNLYRAVLSFTNGHATNKSNSIENISCAFALRKHLIGTGNWEFANRKSLLTLLRLTLDTALDVKQVATSIILDHFDKDLLSAAEKHVVLNTALKHCNSSKFYEIESGAALVSILTNWLPLSALHDQTIYQSYSRYSDFLFDEAASQLRWMKEDILKAIVQSKPFYGAITALLNICFRNGPESSGLTLEFIEKTLRLLKDAVDLFLSILSSKSESREYSSSFAEMGLAIDEAIKNSEIDGIAFDDLSLTPAHQVLVSCIWMSLKVSCEVACEIGTLMYSDESVERSANIIVSVLLRCRHKGVVEAAGTAIGHLTRCLCKEAKYSDLPKAYISRILENDSMECLNVTRRGAGLSIMFHRIVVSDNRRDRPLLHFAVQRLLDLLSDFSHDLAEGVESQRDSPWARRLHFLRALVADKEIHAQLTPYMERISLTCFRYLECETWTIRNASLQLFGSIVPRLVGQSSGDALDFGNGYPINHFVTHYPILADYVTNELRRFSRTFKNFSTTLYLHSNIVHILVVLSKFSTSACSLIDHRSQEYAIEAKRLLRTLLDNPVLHVRRLAAKAYAALTDFLRINVEVEKFREAVLSCRSVNLRHGYLLAVQFLKEKLAVESESLSCLGFVERGNQRSKESAELTRFRNVLRDWEEISRGKSNSKMCYVLETLFLQLSESISDTMSDKDVFIFDGNSKLLSSERMKPGFFQFVDYSTKLYADYINRTNDIAGDILRRMFNSPCVDQSVSFLNHVTRSIPILNIVLEHLFLNEEHSLNELLLNAMVNYVLETLKSFPTLDASELDVEKVIQNSLDVKKKCNLWNLRCVLIVMFSKDQATINEVLTRALNLSVHEEEHVRRIAVELTRFAVYRFAELTSRNRLAILHCCLILLKDEISEIREAVAECLKARVLLTISSEYSNLEHDERIYERLLSEVMLDKLNFATDKGMNLYFVKLFVHGIKDIEGDSVIENPFYHDDNSFLREESKFLNFCFYCCTKRKKHSHDKCPTKGNSTIGYDNNEDPEVLDKIQAKYRLQEMFHFDDTNLEAILNTKHVDYLLRKQQIVIREYSYG